MEIVSFRQQSRPRSACLAARCLVHRVPKRLATSPRSLLRSGCLERASIEAARCSGLLVARALPRETPPWLHRSASAGLRTAIAGREVSCVSDTAFPLRLTIHQHAALMDEAGTG
jgi:hypothetical protein